MALFDMKVLNATLDQLEAERKIPREKIFEAIEQALAAAYKKDYGKRGQIIRATFNQETGDTEFFQIKIVVDDSIVRIAEEADDETDGTNSDRTVHYKKPYENEAEQIKRDISNVKQDDSSTDERIRYNPEHHIFIDDARKIRSGVALEDEIVFPLETEEEFGRIAAQTAKQVIIQRIREAEKYSIMDQYTDLQGEILSGIVQKIDRGTIYVEFDRATGVILRNEQIPGEMYRTGQRIKAYLFLVEETPRGVNLKLSRTHPRFIEALFAIESPEIASGTVEIKAIAREAGSRSKIAVQSHDENIDPIGACVGQKGIRVMTVMGELNGEKIDIIPWSNETREFVSNSLAPAKVLDIEIDLNNHTARIEVADDQLSLAIGKGGQNVRLAAKLTGWRIDIAGVEGAVPDAEQKREKTEAKTGAKVEENVSEESEVEAKVEENVSEESEVEAETSENDDEISTNTKN